MLFLQKKEINFLNIVIKNIEVKIHYPIPLYQQEALKFLSYPKGSFPVTDYHSKNIITFPVDQHLTKEEQNYVIKTVKEFYEKNNYWIRYIKSSKQFKEEKNYCYQK